MSEVRKSITAVDRSAKALTTVGAALTKQLADAQLTIKQLDESVSNQLFEIEAKEAQLTNLNQEFVDKERIAKAELQIKLKENEDKVVSDILRNRGVVAIEATELASLKESVAKLTESIETEVKQAVGKATAVAEAKHAVEIEKLQLGHVANTAEIAAELRYAKEQLLAKDKLIGQLQGQVEEDRKARVEIAKAESAKQAQSINVTR